MPVVWVRRARPERQAPVSYYSVTVIVASICLFLVTRAPIRPGGLLGILASDAVLRVVNPVAVVISLVARRIPGLRRVF